jgi:membrane protease YdiL (CAAX protease family)
LGYNANIHDWCNLMMPKVMPKARNAVLALGLAAPAQAIGVVASLGFPGPFGLAISGLFYVWMGVFPWWWTRQIEKRSLHPIRPTRNELVAGLVLGSAMFAVIVLIYRWIGQTWLDDAFIRTIAAKIGLNGYPTFLLFGFYFTFINLLFEEYFWRWFIDRQCRTHSLNIGPHCYQPPYLPFIMC